LLLEPAHRRCVAEIESAAAEAAASTAPSAASDRRRGRDRVALELLLTRRRSLRGSATASTASAAATTLLHGLRCFQYREFGISVSARRRNERVHGFVPRRCRHDEGALELARVFLLELHEAAGFDQHGFAGCRADGAPRPCLRNGLDDERHR